MRGIFPYVISTLMEEATQVTSLLSGTAFSKVFLSSASSASMTDSVPEAEAIAPRRADARDPL